MKTAPTLHTERLTLRSFKFEDAQDVQRLAGDRDIAATLTRMPHPYKEGMAEKWIRSCYENFKKDAAINFAITLRTEKHLIGGIALRIDRENENAELGYWIGKPYWNRGYCTEAAKAVVGHSFEVLKLNRIHAKYFKRNPASGRVLEKIGMYYEGCFRQHVKKWDTFEDLMGYGMLKTDYDSLAPISSNEHREAI